MTKTLVCKIGSPKKLGSISSEWVREALALVLKDKYKYTIEMAWYYRGETDIDFTDYNTFTIRLNPELVRDIRTMSLETGYSMKMMTSLLLSVAYNNQMCREVI